MVREVDTYGRETDRQTNRQTGSQT